MAVSSHKNDHCVLADCLVSDDEAMMVYISGPAVAGRYQVATADPSDFSKMPAIGIIITKLTTTTCVVQLRGEVIGIYSGLNPGEMLFVDDDGMLSTTPPSPTVLKPFMFVQTVGISFANDAIGLAPDTTLTRQRY